MATWAEICADTVLKVLYKIETNRFGKIMMSPASFWRGGFEIEIGHLLKQLMTGGRAVAECAIETADGIRVADVAWIHANGMSHTERQSTCRSLQKSV